MWLIQSRPQRAQTPVPSSQADPSTPQSIAAVHMVIRRAQVLDDDDRFFSYSAWPKIALSFHDGTALESSLLVSHPRCELTLEPRPRGEGWQKKIILLFSFYFVYVAFLSSLNFPGIVWIQQLSMPCSIVWFVECAASSRWYDPVEYGLGLPFVFWNG